MREIMRERERERERVHKPVKSVVLKNNMDIEKFYEQQFLTTGIGAKLEVKAIGKKMYIYSRKQGATTFIVMILHINACS
jgi:hypothetical protein